MAAMTIRVNIHERIGNQALMRQFFIHTAAITAMTAGATVFKGVNIMPIALSVHGIFLSMAGDTRRFRGDVATLGPRWRWGARPKNKPYRDKKYPYHIRNEKPFARHEAPPVD
jgi:hypothetical protein